jgi:prevent-host-death family protein
VPDGTRGVHPATGPSQDAEGRFSEVVDRALAGTPQWVTRRGKPAVCVVAARDYDQLVAQPGWGIKRVLRSSPHPEIELATPRDTSPGRGVDL